MAGTIPPQFRKNKDDSMVPQVDDFRAEATELRTLLATLDDADWTRPTRFKAWTINDIVQHLHESDMMAAASAAGPKPFAQMRAEAQALRDSGMTRLQVTRHRLGLLTGRHMPGQVKKTSRRALNFRRYMAGPLLTQA